MIEPTAVADANAIIGLAKGGVFPLLSRLYSTLYIPPRVTEEVVVKGQGRPGAGELAHALGSWAREAAPGSPPRGQLSARLSAADREVLAIAQEKGVDHILTSDEDLSREAARLGLSCLSTLEIIVHMKQRGLIPDVKSVLDRMLQAKHGIDPGVYLQVLRTAGE